ncbi:MAG: NUDIX hydrolase [Erysipelotrichaceae bacterium]
MTPRAQRLSTRFYDLHVNEEGFVRIENKYNGVCVLAMDDQGQLLLIEIFRYSIQKQLYECPKGFLEPNETPLEGAKRELWEETNASALTWIDLGTFYPDSGILTTQIHGFLALHADFSNLIAQQEEQVQRCILIPKEEWDTFFPTLDDGITLAMFAKALPFMQSHLQ